MRVSLLVCVNNAFYFAWSFEIGKFCKEEKMSVFILLPCNYLGPFLIWITNAFLFCIVIWSRKILQRGKTCFAIIADLYLQHILFCVVVEVSVLTNTLKDLVNFCPVLYEFNRFWVNLTWGKVKPRFDFHW